ncbi:MAG: hypothetical protein Q3976_03485 [Corynebacterium sp.]|nr:hypothetical protein [Corynebacterium sp.]
MDNFILVILAVLFETAKLPETNLQFSVLPRTFGGVESFPQSYPQVWKIVVEPLNATVGGGTCRAEVCKAKNLTLHAPKEGIFLSIFDLKRHKSRSIIMIRINASQVNTGLG